jgi:hypothetical protein
VDKTKVRLKQSHLESVPPWGSYAKTHKKQTKKQKLKRTHTNTFKRRQTRTRKPTHTHAHTPRPWQAQVPCNTVKGSRRPLGTHQPSTKTAALATNACEHTQPAAAPQVLKSPSEHALTAQIKKPDHFNTLEGGNLFTRTKFGPPAQTLSSGARFNQNLEPHVGRSLPPEFAFYFPCCRCCACQGGDQNDGVIIVRVA